MRFKKRVVIDSGLRQLDIAPLIDCIFLLLIFFMLTSSFVVIPGVNVKLPKALTTENINTQTLTVVISSEDIIYIEEGAVTIEQAETRIKKGSYESIFIKADRKASLGVVVKIWDICKKLGIEKIGIATTFDD